MSDSVKNVNDKKNNEGKPVNDKKIANQMVGKVLIMLIISALLVGIVSISLYRKDNVDKSEEYAQYVSDGIAAMIDGIQMRDTVDSGDTDLYHKSVKTYIDDIKESSDAKFVYVIYFKNDEMYYFAEAHKPGDDYSSLSVFGEKAEDDGFKNSLIERIKNGEKATDYDNYKDYGRIITAYSPIKDRTGDTIGFVGVDLNGDSVFIGTLIFILAIAAVVVFVCILMGLIFRKNVNKFIGKPILQITDAAHRMAVGDIDVELDIKVRNEIGVLREAFNEMNSAVRQQAHILKNLADGDYREHIDVRSEKDIINKSIKNLFDSNIMSIYKTLETAKQVARSATEIEAGSQTVAEGANEQADSIEQFKAMVDNLTRVANENAENISEVDATTRNAVNKVNNAVDTIEQLTKSLTDISDKTKEISTIMQLIDNIAFQTNILALNAAVEAARAGEHGKGFSVVADEVRQLANKSADAAKETEAMITESFSVIEKGSEKANEGNTSIKEVSETSDVIFSAIKNIDEAANNQARAIEDMLARIEEFSAVIQKNSTMSEESAAASAQLSAVAKELESLMEGFKFNEADIQKVKRKR